MYGQDSIRGPKLGTFRCQPTAALCNSVSFLLNVTLDYIGCLELIHVSVKTKYSAGIIPLLGRRKCRTKRGTNCNVTRTTGSGSRICA
ncbi:hypothetical protein RSAG8_13839, partial [Rhizoctonia solani AG-8 WAC10335]